jgi:hypothetical protein
VPQVHSSPIFGLHNRARSLAANALFVFIFSYVSRQADIFTLSPADDLMDFLAGGSHQIISTDAGAAGEQEEEGL